MSFKKIHSFDTKHEGIGKVSKEIEMTREFLKHYKNLRYCVEEKAFYNYDQGLYSPVSDEWVLKQMVTTAHNKDMDADSEIQKFKSTSLNFRKTVLQNIKIRMNINRDDFNQDNLINFKNCYYSLDNRARQEHDGAILSSVQLDYDFDPEALCPLWMKTITDILQNNQQKIDLLQEFFGYCLTKETKYNKAMWLVGNGGNGKGVVSEALKAMLGAFNVSAVELQKFTDTTQIVAIVDKYANIVTEIPTRGLGNYEDQFKKIIGGEDVTFNPKYCAPYTEGLFAKHFISCNRLPTIKDRSDAFFDRMLIIEFNKKFRGTAGQDINLPHKLKAERAGIFRWALEGLSRLQKNGVFTVSEEMTEQLKQLEMSSNPLKEFCEEVIVVDINKNSFVTRKELYESYSQWMEENGMGGQKMYVNNFTTEIRQIYKMALPMKDVRKAYLGKLEKVWQNLTVKKNNLYAPVENVEF